jgi:hypothetical protein
MIPATSCAKVDTEHVRVVWASAPAHPAKALGFYVYGSGLDASNYAIIGRNNAVTDNFGSVPLAAGWRIGTDLGAAEQVNNPLQATTYGIPLS